MVDHFKKYIKYKNKYLSLKDLKIGGMNKIMLITGIKSDEAFLSILESENLISTVMRKKLVENPDFDIKNFARNILGILMDDIRMADIYPGGDEQRHDLNWFDVIVPNYDETPINLNKYIYDLIAYGGSIYKYFLVFEFDMKELEDKFATFKIMEHIYLVGDSKDDLLKYPAIDTPVNRILIKERNGMFIFYSRPGPHGNKCPNATFPIPNSIAVTPHIVNLPKNLFAIYYAPEALPKSTDIKILFEKYLKLNKKIYPIEPYIPEAPPYEEKPSVYRSSAALPLIG